MKRFLHQMTLVFLVGCLALMVGCSSSQAVRQDISTAQKLGVVKAGPFDTGKMWTFDFPPMEYFKKTYNFNPTKEWFEKARTAAVRIPGCSGAFVSEDGLLMTNHHCARSALVAVKKQGEKLEVDGFYAPTLEEERKVANSYVDQLLVIEDVTKEVLAAFDKGTTDKEKDSLRAAAMSAIRTRYTEEYKKKSSDNMIFNVLSFYNGGRYSLYGYKRYNDVRIVFAPEEAVAFFGGDPDNYTYPRYDFDVSFFRVYDNGKPLKTTNFYFPFSKEGAQEGEAVFVLGTPGRTNRLLTIAQYETLRDVSYPAQIDGYNSQVNAINEYLEKNPDKKVDYINTIFGITNMQKRIIGYQDGLVNPLYWAKKEDFEKTFREAVLSNTQLKAKYGDLWKEIGLYESQIRALTPELNGLTATSRTQYFSLAASAVNTARGTGRAGGGGRPGGGGGGARTVTPEIEKHMLVDQLEFMKKNLGSEYPAFKKLLAGRLVQQAAEEFSKTALTVDREKFNAMKPEDVLKSTDPIITFVAETQPRITEIQRTLTELRAKQTPLIQALGRAMYDVYGTNIPPDASGSLRMSDGVVKGFSYNGTIAPPATTFYGMYDRYYSFGKKEPFFLPERWANPPADFKMSTPMNFSSTNDIIGGNSGSSVVNRNLEVVGLIFDSNIEGLAGNSIFDTEKNRAVSVHSAGIVEGLDKIYRATRIANELRSRKIIQ
ncbi:MAG: S46 family peptidase [bacterium]